MAVQKFGGVLFWGPCTRDVILGPYLVPLILLNSHVLKPKSRPYVEHEEVMK